MAESKSKKAGKLTFPDSSMTVDVTKTVDLGTCYHHHYIDPKDKKEKMIIEPKSEGQPEPAWLD